MHSFNHFLWVSIIYHQFSPNFTDISRIACCWWCCRSLAGATHPLNWAAAFKILLKVLWNCLYIHIAHLFYIFLFNVQKHFLKFLFRYLTSLIRILFCMGCLRFSVYFHAGSCVLQYIVWVLAIFSIYFAHCLAKCCMQIALKIDIVPENLPRPVAASPPTPFFFFFSSFLAFYSLLCVPSV